MKSKILFFLVFLPVSVIAGTHFKDVINSPFATYIDKSAKYGIISGYGNGLFKPNNTVSFIESLKIIINAGPKKNEVNHMQNTHWSHGFKEFYQKNNFLSFLSFKDNEPITRDFAIYLLLRQLNVDLQLEDYYKISNGFKDISINTPLAAYINFSKEVGITNGFADGTFGAKKFVTRGELTKMAYNTLIENRDKVIQRYEELFSFNSAQPESVKKPIIQPVGIHQNNQLPQDKPNQITYRYDQVVSLENVKNLVKDQVIMQGDVIYGAASDPQRIKVLKNTVTGEKFFRNTNFPDYILFYTHAGSQILSKNTQTLNQNEIRDSMIDAINQFRRQYGRPPVKHHPKLQKVAQKYAKEMYDTKHFDHISASGENAESRILKVQYDPLLFTENIAHGQASVNEAMQGFINSPSHRDNMLFNETENVGIGFYGGYWVQVFATEFSEK